MPAFIAPATSRGAKPQSDKPLMSEKVRNRVQNADLTTMTDRGRCLSMHQPWASLLVQGIKQHEGRKWYSSHRGRLWIAATAKEVEPDDIAELEEFYRAYHGGALNFPKHYPSSCVLGCVDVADVVDSEDYQQRFAEDNQESSSPYVFLCTNPQELIVKLNISGNHKIWQLDKGTHESARVGVRSANPGDVRPV